MEAENHIVYFVGGVVAHVYPGGKGFTPGYGFNNQYPHAGLFFETANGFYHFSHHSDINYVERRFIQRRGCVMRR